MIHGYSMEPILVLQSCIACLPSYPVGLGFRWLRTCRFVRILGYKERCLVAVECACSFVRSYTGLSQGDYHAHDTPRCPTYVVLALAAKECGYI